MIEVGLKLADILLVEDNEGDIELTKESFEEVRLKNKLHIVRDGEEAIDFLLKRNGYENAPLPDIILLDLNLPKMNGKEVLERVKSENTLKKIPVVVLTSSNADRDIVESYNLNANCYIVKPVDAMKFMEIIKKIEEFWIEMVCLPNNPSNN